MVYEADTRTGELRKSGLRVKLQGKPFQLLVALLERPGELVGREDLKRALWSADTYVEFDRSLNIAVRKLRTALNDTAEVPRYVETLRGRGYRFIAPVGAAEPALALVPPAATEDAQADEAILPAVGYQPYPQDPRAVRAALGAALDPQLRPKLKVISTTVDDFDSQVVARLVMRHKKAVVALLAGAMVVVAGLIYFDRAAGLAPAPPPPWNSAA